MPSLEEEAMERLITKQLENPEGRQRLATSMLTPLQNSIDRGIGFRERGTYDWTTTSDGGLVMATWVRVLAKASDEEKSTESFLQVDRLIAELRRPYLEGEVKLAEIFRSMSLEDLQHIRPTLMVRFRGVADTILRAEADLDENPSLWDRLGDA